MSDTLWRLTIKSCFGFWMHCSFSNYAHTSQAAIDKQIALDIKELQLDEYDKEAKDMQDFVDGITPKPFSFYTASTATSGPQCYIQLHPPPVISTSTSTVILSGPSDLKHAELYDIWDGCVDVTQDKSLSRRHTRDESCETDSLSAVPSDSESESVAVHTNKYLPSYLSLLFHVCLVSSFKEEEE